MHTKIHKVHAVDLVNIVYILCDILIKIWFGKTEAFHEFCNDTVAGDEFWSNLLDQEWHFLSRTRVSFVPLCPNFKPKWTKFHTL